MNGEFLFLDGHSETFATNVRPDGHPEPTVMAFATNPGGHRYFTPRGRERKFFLDLWLYRHGRVVYREQPE